VDARLKPGDVVDVLYEGTKAQFRIVWCGKPGSAMAGEVGVENLSAGTMFWDVDPLGCRRSKLDQLARAAGYSFQIPRVVTKPAKHSDLFEFLRAKKQSVGRAETRAMRAISSMKRKRREGKRKAKQKREFSALRQILRGGSRGINCGSSSRL
jgi:hypothetical protein